MSAVILPAAKQRTWTEKEYLDLPGGKLIEFDNGMIEVLPMPTPRHQRIVFRLQKALAEFVEARSCGEVLAAPLPVRVGSRKYREPDIMFRRSSDVDLESDQEPKFWDQVELAVEVTSEGAKNRNRDLVTKRREYASAGILEYWIVDTEQLKVTVLVLRGTAYVETGVLGIDDTIRSTALPGFEFPVAKVFAK